MKPILKMTILTVCLIAAWCWAENFTIRQVWDNEPAYDGIYYFRVCEREEGDVHSVVVGYDIQLLDGWTASVVDGEVQIRKQVTRFYWVNGTSEVYHGPNCRYRTGTSTMLTDVSFMRPCKVCGGE